MKDAPENKLYEKTIGGLHSFLTERLPKIANDAPILDIGCGSGAWLQRLGRMGYKNLFGVEKQELPVEIKNAVFFRANVDLNDWNLSERRFGLITAIEVIEHLQNQGHFLYNVSRYLDRGGYFLLTTPNIHSINARLRFFIQGQMKSFDHKGDPTHIYPVLLPCLKKQLSACSMTIVRQWGYPEQGSLVSKVSTQIISRFFEFLLPKIQEGDTLCLLIQKTSDCV